MNIMLSYEGSVPILLADENFFTEYAGSSESLKDYLPEKHTFIKEIYLSVSALSRRKEGVYSYSWLLLLLQEFFILKMPVKTKEYTDPKKASKNKKFTIF